MLKLCEPIPLIFWNIQSATLSAEMHVNVTLYTRYEEKPLTGHKTQNSTQK